MKDRAIKHLMRSYGIDIENDDEFLSDLRRIMDDLYVKCPLCGEAENLHENTNYHDTSKPPEILCNECGEYFFASATINSVRPEVVVPSEERMNDLAQAFDELPKTKESKDTWECAAFKKGSRMTLSELRRLNPTLTFTELNHTAPTGDKSDEG